jgi:SPX domain protein involved in polyphosphate accumulation
MFSLHSENDGKVYRYERKFYLPDISFAEVEAHVRLNPGLFSEIFHSRWVNNIYFDTQDLDCFMDNVEGGLFRMKERIRWYGSLLGPVEKPILEFKLKRGLVGRKESFRMAPLNFDDAFDRRTSNEWINTSDIPGAIKLRLLNSVPSLVNRYLRKYFLSADGKFRITIDSELEFHFVGPHNNSFTHPVTNNRDIILEMKYDVENDDMASIITGSFPFRVTKSSKYVQGIVLTS